MGPHRSSETKLLRTAGAALARRLGSEEAPPGELILRLFSDPDFVAKLEQCGGSVRCIHNLIQSLAAEPSPIDEVTGRSSAATVKHALNAFWRWLRQGFDMADPPTTGRRLAACRRCPHCGPPPDTLLYALAKGITRETRICTLCGCFVFKKAGIATESCPAPDPVTPEVTRWGEPRTG